MAKVRVSVPFSLPSQDLWDVVGQFTGLADWHPEVERCEVADGGRARRLHLVDGSVVVERLIEADDLARNYTYAVIQAPLPIREWTASIAVRDADHGCIMDWTADFEPLDPACPEITNQVRGIYESGMLNLKRLLND